ncbi:pseudouridine synthase [Halomonas elongata]|uniref:pseudouridine synthase n=1 Tax=Halomonas elongata TaxID=2746 RepID=UPI0023B14D0D|nr:pseudouridine synthase [Halomonas elongata]
MTEALPILHRDDHLIAVHKPAGMLVHRSALARGERHFLLQTLRDQIGQRVYPVHRLDRPTSGLMVFALDSEIAGHLADAFAAHRVTKRYLAVVRGLGPESERLDYALRDEDGRRPKAEMPAREARTDVRRLDSVELPVSVDRYPSARYSLMEACPRTGRRHQIRRHLSRRGYPIIGDAKHGKGVHNRFFADQLACPRLLLAAVELGFDHPVDGRRLTIGCALDASMTALFQRFGWSGHLPANDRNTSTSPHTMTMP